MSLLQIQFILTMLGCIIQAVGPLNCRGLALFFCLDTKEPKDQVIRKASLRS